MQNHTPRPPGVTLQCKRQSQWAGGQTAIKAQSMFPTLFSALDTSCASIACTCGNCSSSCCTIYGIGAECPLHRMLHQYRNVIRYKYQTSHDILVRCAPYTFNASRTCEKAALLAGSKLQDRSLFHKNLLYNGKRNKQGNLENLTGSFYLSRSN